MAGKEKEGEEIEKKQCPRCHLTFEHQNDLEKHLEENHLFLIPDYEEQESSVELLKLEPNHSKVRFSSHQWNLVKVKLFD